MCSLLAFAAVAWFAYNAFAFMPQGAGVYNCPGNIGGIDGDPAAVAVTWAAVRYLWASPCWRSR